MQNAPRCTLKICAHYGMQIPSFITVRRNETRLIGACPSTPHCGACGITGSRQPPGLVPQKVCLTWESMTLFAALFFSMTSWKLPSWNSITRQRNREEICRGHSPLARCRVLAPRGPGLGASGPSPAPGLSSQPGHHRQWLWEDAPFWGGGRWRDRPS